MRRVLAIAIACFSIVSTTAMGDAHAAIRKHTSIPAQGLGPALQRLAKEHKVQIVFRSELVGDRTTSGAVGDLTFDEAMKELLKGTDITYQYLGADAITLESPSYKALPAGRQSKAYGNSLGAPALLVSETTDVRDAPQNGGGGGGREDIVALEEVVVTARKRNESVIDVPSTVVTFGREKLEALHADSVNDLQPSIPNFFFNSTRPLETNVTMRGLGAGIGGVAPGVGMYIDGAYQTSSASFLLPLFDLERVEVLKGPQGTLYGRNSLAGAINFITRAPSNQFEGDVNAEFGNGDTRKGSVSVSGPIIADKLSARVSFGMQRRDGFYQFADGTDDADKDDYDAISGRVRFTPTENFSADLSFAYQDLRGGNMLVRSVGNINDAHNPLILPGHFQFGVLAGETPRGGFRHRGGTLNLTYSTSSFDITSITTYDRQSQYSYYYIGTGDFDIADAVTTVGGNSVSEELRIQSTGTGPFHWLVGAYYTKGANNSAGCCGSVIGGFAFNFPGGFVIPVPEDRFRGYAGFTDLEYELSPKWVVGAGFRYDSVNKQVDNSLSPAGKQEKIFSAAQPKATVRYRLSGDGQLYATVAKGFREGGFNSVFLGTPYETYNNDTAWSYEAGWKSSFLDHRGYVGLSAFFINAPSFTSVASLPLGNISSLVPINVGKVHSSGAELEMNYRVTRRFTANLGGGYNRAIATSLVPSAVPGTANVDEQILFAPKWNFRVAGLFEQPVGDQAVLSFNAAFNGIGPTNFQGSGVTGELAKRDPVYMLDLGASFDWNKKYRVTAFVKNATDKRYSTAFFDQTTCAAFGCPTSGAIYNMPRYYGLSLNAKWR